MADVARDQGLGRVPVAAHRRRAGSHGPAGGGRGAGRRGRRRVAVSVAIIGGTGDEGFGLALRLARAGEDGVIGSRAEERGQAAAEKAADLLGLGSGAGTRGGIEGTSNEKAAAGSELVFVTVPFAGQAEIYRSIKDALRPDAVVCDTTTPLATAVGRPAWQVLTPWEGSAAEQAKAILSKNVRLVSGFHTISGHALQSLDRDLEGDVLLCGAEPEAKAAVGALVGRIPNLRWVDAGPLSMARVIERLTAVLVSVNRAYGITT
ncbi:MAG: NADPH-dependent F420 reductase, partial [Actinobacteria bacterium]